MERNICYVACTAWLPHSMAAPCNNCRITQISAECKPPHARLAHIADPGVGAGIQVEGIVPFGFEVGGVLVCGWAGSCGVSVVAMAGCKPPRNSAPSNALHRRHNTIVAAGMRRPLSAHQT